jgi:hypothetical protein
MKGSWGRPQWVGNKETEGLLATGGGGNGIGVTAMVASLLGAALAFAAIIVAGLSLTNTNRLQNQLVPTAVVATSSCPAGVERHNAAYGVRVAAAASNLALGAECHPINGDEALYAGVSQYFSQYTKGLAHDPIMGHVVAGYVELVAAANSRSHAAFEALPLGGARKMTNPEAGLAFDLIGSDAHALAIPPPPAFASAEMAAELVQLYWMAVLRDVPFEEYNANVDALAAIAELNALPAFAGPTPVTPQNLFRGRAPGCDVGPFISQFLYLPCPMGANTIDQRITPRPAGVDYMKTFTTWLAIQNGGATIEAVPAPVDPLRFIYNGRDLSHWVHIDVLWQAYYHAALLLMGPMGAPLNPSNPYVTSATAAGFATFGGPHIATLLTEVATRALHAAWHKKWFVHRRLRPEAYAARVDRHINGVHVYPLDSSVLTSAAAARIFALHGTYFLPQAFPEGSPTHPSYAAGHATVAGACVTILKAFFDGTAAIASPVTPDVGGATLIPYLGPALTVNGELNKLAANVGIGRNIAGVHYESDGHESFKLGERVAIATLRDLKATFHEPFSGWTFENFEGVTVTI